MRFSPTQLLETLEDPAGFERVVCRLRAYYEKQARQYATMDGFRRVRPPRPSIPSFRLPAPALTAAAALFVTQRNTGGPIPGGNETRGILTGRLMLATKFHRPSSLLLLRRPSPPSAH